MPGFLYVAKRILASIEWNQSMIPTSKAARAEAKRETFFGERNESYD
jgi:hypothetical protein